MKLPILALISLSACIFAAPEDDLRAGNRKFSANLFTKIIDDQKDKNFVFSPFPVQTILAALASAGTLNSATSSEIRNKVGLLETSAKTEQAYQAILPELLKSDDDFKIFDATKLYFDSDYSVKKWFKDIVQNTYKAEIEVMSFKDSTNARKTINEWVSKKTDNKLTDLIEPNGITKNSKTVLVNALYVMGKWDKPFSKFDNYRGTFYGLKKNSEVEFMTNFKTYEWRKDTSALYLRMELIRSASENAYVEFILPHDRNGLAQVEQNVGNAFSTHPYSVAKVNVTLPKFSIHTDLKMKQILQNLGLTKIFNWCYDLPGAAYRNHGWTVVSDVSQRALIEVSEWGISAAAAVKVDTYVDDPFNLETFCADHPFLFQVVVNDIVTFAGRVVDL